MCDGSETQVRSAKTRGTELVARVIWRDLTANSAVSSRGVANAQTVRWMRFQLALPNNALRFQHLRAAAALSDLRRK